MTNEKIKQLEAELWGAADELRAINLTVIYRKNKVYFLYL